MAEAMEELEWTSEAAIQLIQEYEKRPELWDTSHPMYRMHTIKHKMWIELAKTFECEITDLRKKLNSIFASHRRVKANLQAGRRTSWFLYPYLRFLPGHLDNNEANSAAIETPKAESKQTKKTERESPESEQTTSEDDDNEDVEEVVVKSELEEQRPKRRSVPQSTPKPRLGKSLKRKVVSEAPRTTSQLDSKLIEALKLLKRSELSRKKDECDSFGEYIATSLRKHDERTQSMIKQAINNILFEQEMKKYSGGQYTVVLTNMEENPLVLGDHETEK